MMYSFRTNGVLRKLLVVYPRAVAPPPGTNWCITSSANDNVPVARPQNDEASAVAR